MKILAVARSSEALNYAVFDREYLIEYGVFPYNNNKELFDIATNLLKQHTITYVVVNQIDYVKMKRRKEAFDLIKFRTVIKLATATYNNDNGNFFLELATNGWEQYLFGDTIQGVALEKEKVRIVNEIYNTKLIYDTHHTKHEGHQLADAIILGQSFSQGRLNHTRNDVYAI